ncbi:MAG: DUF445 family protein [Leptospiraceae bacterium]|nr:DUF445 family protein [Leptospiraceae bacterium]
MDVAKLDLWFRRGISIITLLFGSIQLYLTEKNIWIDAGFIICMAGIVGYYTNYLAIKMLFQPKQGRVLGWEGLVPKNKANIAQSLGKSIQTNLLAPEILLEYVYERKLIETGTHKLGEWLDELLKDSEVRSKVTTKIISVLQEKGPELLSQIFNFTEDTLKDLAKNPDEIKKLWEQIRKRINEYIQSRDNREYLVNLIKRIVLEELPRLSIILNNAIDEYLKNKDTIGNIGFGFKKILSFDSGALQDLLQKFIEDEETKDQFMGVMDQLVIDLQKKLESPETQDFILSKVKGWADMSGEYSRQTFLPAAIERLKKFLDDSKNWDKVGNYSFRILDYAKDKMIEFMKSSEGSEYLKTNIAKIIHQINVTNLVQEQVMKLDTDELEKMILDNTGGNLVMIQFLGGVLGLIAGFIQVHIYFAVPVTGLIVVTWISYARNQKKYGIT